MEEEFENFENGTDSYSYKPSTEQLIEDWFILLATILSLCADCIIILMVARHKKMRNKTNLIIMNIAINDTLFSICNLHSIQRIVQIVATTHVGINVRCMVGFIDALFQMNVTLLTSLLISNYVVKKFKIKWLLGCLYGFVIICEVINSFLCSIDLIIFLYHIEALILLLCIIVLIFKEFNACYKKIWKKDPLSKATRFRLNFVRIYIYIFCLMYCFLIFGSRGTFLIYFAVTTAHMLSVYFLIYLVCYDKNYKICFLNLFKCGNAGNYNVDATITFTEDLCDNADDDKQVNINYNNQNPVVNNV